MTTQQNFTEAHAVAHDIRQQIEIGALMALGASDLTTVISGPLSVTDLAPGLRFSARILPFLKNGQRGSKPRVMQVYVNLNARDYYDITVIYPKRESVELVVHAEACDVDCFQLSRTLLALDYDGPEAFNPRYV